MDKGVHNNRAPLPSFSTILNNSIRIHSESTIGQDGQVQFYWGLKLTQETTAGPSTSTVPSNIRPNPTQNKETSASNTRVSTPNIVPQTVKRRNPKKNLERAAFTSEGIPVTYKDFGPPTHQCRCCDAIMWYDERSNKAKRATNPSFSLCCQDGKVFISKFRETPPPLNTLLDFTDPATTKFRDQIRVYNSMFCFTSFGAKIDQSINTGRAPYTFRINGQNYHLLGSLLPTGGIPPKFCQLYFFDTENEVRNRMSAFINNEGGEEIDERIVESLIDMLNHSSSVSKAFRMARDWCAAHNSNDFQLRLLGQRTISRQYNAPSVAEVAALITTDFGEGIAIRDIIVNNKDMGPQRISELHPSYMALQYPLLFPYGEDGFHDKIPYHNCNIRIFFVVI
ncbi:hypothetical protein OROMI_009005 [Orobanche minor]